MTVSADQLRSEHCQPLSGGEHRIDGDALTDLLGAVPAWTVQGDSPIIGRDFRFKGFLPALSFANAIGWMAEQEGHHPDLELGWGYVRVRFSTHDVGGLSRNDFICAAKVDALFKPL